MQSYQPGTDVPLTFDLVGEQPTALRWRVLDENEVVLQDWTAADLPDGTSLTLVVPAALNQLPAQALRALRGIELEVTTALGAWLSTQVAMLKAGTVLLAGFNTFQSYFQALFLIEGQPADFTSGWNSAERDARESALVEAHQRILQLPIALEFGSDQSRMTSDSWLGARRSERLLRNLAPADVLLLYAPLLTALRLAQVAEADDVLNIDSPRAAGNAGMTSLTVGESSQTWRQGATGSSKPMEYPVCPRALAHLQRWLRYSGAIGRS
jgi:hypothetical protein